LAVLAALEAVKLPALSEKLPPVVLLDPAVRPVPVGMEER
jgi:hypothetical protein